VTRWGARARRAAIQSRWQIHDRVNRERRGRLGVLLYHRITDDRDLVPGLAVTPGTFRGHLELVARLTDPVPLADAVADLRARRLARPVICVTFDDGYQDNAAIAVPIAERLGVPITIFVTTGALGTEGFWWDRLWASVGGNDTQPFWRLHAELKMLPGAAREARLAALTPARPVRGTPMTHAALTEVAGRPLVSVGAHSRSHSVLAALELDEQRREIADPRDDLAGLVGREVTLMSYPFGKRTDISPTTEAIVAATGLEAAFTSVAGVATCATRPFAIPRLSVHEMPGAMLARALATTFGVKIPRGGRVRV
jgi:peptidoglycan/xylan/chitin deacetylase (PgdA/CDA1 family)